MKEQRKPLNKPFDVTYTIQISFSGKSVGDGQKTVFPVMIWNKITDNINRILGHAQAEEEIYGFIVKITSERNNITQKEELFEDAKEK